MSNEIKRKFMNESILCGLRIIEIDAEMKILSYQRILKKTRAAIRKVEQDIKNQKP